MDTDIIKVEAGYLGAFNNGYVMEIPALVEKYLEIINHDDVFSALEACQGEQLYDIILSDIVHNDPDRARYFFNNIVAYYVIPELIAAHVVKGYYNWVLTFIEKMRTNPYLLKFWNVHNGGTGTSYYELAVYAALECTMGKNADTF
ncbi:hypothetical protein H4R34_005751, partial [Dimargaris verticillata]